MAATWVLIPARYASSRLPGKPLALLADVPLIEHVRLRVSGVPGLDRVIVATDDPRIAAVVRAGGGEAVLTGPHPSGTARCAAALAALGGAPEVVVNVQGDQPLIDPAHVLAAAAAARRAPIATLAAPYRGDPADPARVKVQWEDGLARAFSRQPLPGAWLHVGVYAFTPAGLRAAVAAPPSPSSRSEDLEQLAWHDAGLPIAVASVDNPGPSVDTPEDLARVAALLRVAR